MMPLSRAALLSMLTLVVTCAVAHPSIAHAQKLDGLRIANFGSYVRMVEHEGAVIVVGQDLGLLGGGLIAKRVLANGTLDPAWPSEGVIIAPGSYSIGWGYASLLGDGAGGAYIAWYDNRGGTPASRATRILANGSIAPGWPLFGRLLPGSSVGAWVPRLVTDNAGGCFVVWKSGNFPRVIRLDSSGAVSTGWPSTGRDLFTNNTYVDASAEPQCGPDGSAGILAISPRYNGLGVTRLLPDATTATGWENILLDNGDVPRICSDGNGGAYAAWLSPSNSAPSPLRAARISATGQMITGWPLTTSLYAHPYDRELQISALSSGELMLAFNSRDVYDGLLCVNPNGQVKSDWPASGLARPEGSRLALQEPFESTDYYVAQVDNAYGLLPLAVYLERFTTSPQRINRTQLSSGDVSHLSLTRTSSGGVLVSWLDSRYTSRPVVIQHVAPDGTLLFPNSDQPIIESVRDVPGDQGGKVKVSWLASGAEVLTNAPTEEYWVWRSVPPNRLTAGALARVGVLEEATPESRQGLFRSSASGLADYYWEFHASQPASRLGRYSRVCETGMDSLATGNPKTAFLVQWRNPSGSYIVSSEPDSGYSVDNLAPPIPLPFTAKYTPLENFLHWAPSRSPDFQQFRLYRSPYSTFPAGATVLVAATQDTGFVDTGGAAYYKLVAVDVHGNISRAAVVSHSAPTSALASFVEGSPLGDRIRVQWFIANGPGGTARVQRRTEDGVWSDQTTVYADGNGIVTFEDLDVTPGTRYRYRVGVQDEGLEVFAGETPALWIGGTEGLRMVVTRNPVTDGRLGLRMAIPGEAPAELELYDMQGRRVQSMSVPATDGLMQDVWMTPAAALAPGVYMLRLQHGGKSIEARTVIID